MTDFAATLKDLHRPRLLIRAARHGLADYRRERDLRRLLPDAAADAPARTLPLLLAREAEMEDVRVAGDARYSVVRHIDLLIALMGEMRMTIRPARGD